MLLRASLDATVPEFITDRSSAYAFSFAVGIRHALDFAGSMVLKIAVVPFLPLPLVKALRNRCAPWY
jgi:hypothetical protein